MKRPTTQLLGAAICVAGIATVVLVRASAPAGRYSIASGTVYDTKTKLTWQQSAPAMAVGQAAAASYCSALSLDGPTGWRLPTMKELLTIVDVSVPSPGPAIDLTAFPGATNAYFWSSTPEVATSGFYWYVQFDTDAMNGYGVGSSTFSVRCVR